MPMIDGVKFSCSPCIRGHRSAHCPDTHSDRPLVEVKRKGRPVSQCKTCRDARKTKALHGKCNCEGKAEPEASSELERGIAALLDPVRPPKLRSLAAKSGSSSVGTESPARSRAASVISSTDQVDDQQATAGRKKSVTGSKKREMDGLHELAHGHSATSSTNVSRSHYDPYASPYARASTSEHYQSQSSASSCHSLLNIQPQPSSSGYANSVHSAPVPDPVERLYGSSFFLPLTNAQNESKLCYCGPSCTCAGCHVHDPAGVHLHASGVRCGVSCQSFGLCSGDMDLPLGISRIATLMDVISEAEEPLHDSAGTVDHSVGGPYQTLSSVFQSHTNQFQNWPSTSDLNDSRAGSMYSGSNMSSHDDGDVQDEFMIMNEPSNAVGAGPEDIARWRSDLELDADFRELLEGRDPNYPVSSRLPPPTDSSSQSSIHSADFDFASGVNNFSTNPLPTPTPTLLSLQQQHQLQQQQLLACHQAVGLFDPHSLHDLDNHPSRFNPLSSIYSNDYRERYSSPGDEIRGSRYGTGGRSDYSSSISSEADQVDLNLLNQLSLNSMDSQASPHFGTTPGFTSDSSGTSSSSRPTNGLNFEEPDVAAIKRQIEEEEEEDTNQTRAHSNTGIALDRFKTERPPTPTSFSNGSNSSSQRAPSDPSLSLERVKTERPPSVFSAKGFFKKIISKADIVKK